MSKHSQAPFTARVGASGNQFIYAAGRKDPIAGVCILGPAWENFENGPANLALFCAAPDLLAVAEAVAAHFDGTDAPLGAAARAAIAKARGE